MWLNVIHDFAESSNINLLFDKSCVWEYHGCMSLLIRHLLSGITENNRGIKSKVNTQHKNCKGIYLKLKTMMQPANSVWYVQHWS